MPGLFFGFIVVVIAIGSFRDSNEALLKRAQDIFSPLAAADLPPPSSADGLAELGRQLFFDPRISRDGQVSCASCHNPSYYGADKLQKSFGVSGLTTSRNAPSVFNQRFHHIFHWRSDRSDLEDQARRSFTDPEALGHPDERAALSRLRQAGYRENLQTAARALAEFQSRLTTPESAFDRFLEGDVKSLSQEQKKGLRQFIHLGCVTCHSGTLLGGRDLARFGLGRDYWTVTGVSPSHGGKHDLGRMDVTGNQNDRNVFKVPSLRNVAMTAPYFHDGSAPDLETAIRWMGELQLERKLSKQEVRELQSFLESLTGRLPEKFSSPY